MLAPLADLEVLQFFVLAPSALDCGCREPPSLFSAVEQKGAFWGTTSQSLLPLCPALSRPRGFWILRRAEFTLYLLHASQDTKSKSLLCLSWSGLGQEITEERCDVNNLTSSQNPPGERQRRAET